MERTERPEYPVLTLLRALMLGQITRAVGPVIGARLARGLAFRCLCRLEIGQGMPHPTVLIPFCAALKREGWFEEALVLVYAQLWCSSQPRG